ncbi:hypothetical protein CC86DRAFT_373561 [Ophiobolus disseminans]|uniref:Transmembrane protein n=1 Tax=Ophiobolus disseminans TaxID=1469910 RepID=A0A6A6ZN35_9PLEO|nr:hypothetical protein CC86DRAFT_373561 [Ophiobolus disseminans]
MANDGTITLRVKTASLLNSAILFISLALIGISTASLYLTGHGMKTMDNVFPPGKYEWYRGETPGTKHIVWLRYDGVNEGFILAGGAIGLLAGIVGAVGSVLSFRSPKQASVKPTLYFLALPGAVAFIATLIALISSSVIFNTSNGKECYWENGYRPENVFTCSRELAACATAPYFSQHWESPDFWPRYQARRTACGETQTGRHLVIPLFVVAVLLFALSGLKVVLAKKALRSESGEGADERVERLQREEE